MYGIEVYSKAGLHLELTEQEWAEIKAAIGWMIENEGGNGNTVYVEAMDADKTIRALNAIGFTTDEDYLIDPDAESYGEWQQYEEADDDLQPAAETQPVAPAFSFSAWMWNGYDSQTVIECESREEVKERAALVMADFRRARPAQDEAGELRTNDETLFDDGEHLIVKIENAYDYMGWRYEFHVFVFAPVVVSGFDPNENEGVYAEYTIDIQPAPKTQPAAETPANHGFEQWQLEQLPLGLVAKAGGRWCQATHYGVLDDSEDRLVIEAGNDGLTTDYSSDFDDLDGLLSAMADFAPPAAWVEYGLDDDIDDDPAPLKASR